MKGGTVLIILGIIILVIINIVQYMQNRFPTYSLFYLMAGMFLGGGFATNLNIGGD